MDEILRKLAEQDKKLDEIYKTMHSLQNYFKWTFIITIVFFVLPLIALIFLIPRFLSLIALMGGGLGL